MIEQREGEGRGAFRKRRWRTMQRTLNAEGKVTSRQQRREPSLVPVTIDNAVVKFATTVYDREGRADRQFVRTEPSKAEQKALWEGIADHLAQRVSFLPSLPCPVAGGCVDDLLACYPVGDHHFGMLAWKHDAGGSYDISIASELLAQATARLVSSTPASRHALVVLLGDFFHYDGHQPLTPTGKNLLDADSRFPKMIGAALDGACDMIDTVAAGHEQVHVIVEIGNHDLSTSVFLANCLARLYKNTSRITVDISPKHFHYYHFGKCLIQTHHGHTVKPEGLKGVMVEDQPEAWGASKYRFSWTGHVHHRNSADFGSVAWESFRILAPSDAHGHQHGFRSPRDMKAIVLHREYGEVERHTVNPEMFK
jgi:hypothetical protein